MKTAIGMLLVIGMLGMLVMILLMFDRIIMSPTVTASVSLTEAQKRESLLMPKIDSPAWKEWVGKYGDTAESWEMFTLMFHTKYVGNLDRRLIAVEKMLAVTNKTDPNGLTAVTKPN